jgi:DNA-binding MarR family transcriptional regulator
MADRPTPEQFRDVAELRAALRRFLRRSGEISEANGLTPRTHLLLLMIKGSLSGREATVSELAERLQLSQSTVTELVKRAEHEGLVVRTRSSDDGRVVYVSATEEGDRRIAASVAAHGPERELLFEILGSLKP